MYRQTLIFIFLITSCFISKGQTTNSIVDTNRLWSVKYNSCESPYPYFDNYFCKFSGDTLIALQHYKKVFTSSDTTLINWSHHGYIREDSIKNIYYRNSTGYEGLLYNFNVNIGDTVYIRNTNILDTTVQMIVHNIDSIFIYNKYVKRIILNHDSISPQYDEIWIDGIGSMNGVLHSCRNSYFYPGICYELLCFTENDTLKYINPNYSSCYYHVGIYEISQNNIKCTVYPSPANNKIIIELQNAPSTQKNFSSIYNIQGQLLLQNELQQIKSEVDILSLEKGLYFIKIESEENIIIKNFIKE